jgi:hypothetical protein
MLLPLALIGGGALVGIVTLGASRAKGDARDASRDPNRIVGSWHMANHRTGSPANTNGVFTFYGDGNFAYTFGSVINSGGAIPPGATAPLPFTGRSGGRGTWKWLPRGNGNPAAASCYDSLEADVEVVSEEILYKDGNGAGMFIVRQKVKLVGDQIMVTGKFEIDAFSGTKDLGFDDNTCTGDGSPGNAPGLSVLISGVTEGGGVRVADAQPMFAGFSD